MFVFLDKQENCKLPVYRTDIGLAQFLRLTTQVVANS